MLLRLRCQATQPVGERQASGSNPVGRHGIEVRHPDAKVLDCVCGPGVIQANWPLSLHAAADCRYQDTDGPRTITLDQS